MDIQSLTRTAEKLNALSDRLTPVIDDWDMALAGLDLGIIVWVKHRTEPDLLFGYSVHQYKWSAHKRKEYWGLCVCLGGRQWWMREAPRNLRMIGLEYLPYVLRALVVEAKRLLPEMEAATRTASEFVAAIQGELP